MTAEPAATSYLIARMESPRKGLNLCLTCMHAAPGVGAFCCQAEQSELLGSDKKKEADEFPLQ